MVIVALVVVLVIVLMGGDDDSNSSSPGETSPGRSSSDAELTSAEERLSTHVPKKNRDTCTHGKSVFDGLVAAVECFPKDSVIDSVVYIQFDSSAAMNTAYEEILTQNSVVRESGGSCSKGEIGEGTYNNEEGRSMCVVDDEGATVVWTDAALNIIGSARNESGDIRGVGEWWSDGPSGPA